MSVRRTGKHATLSIGGYAGADLYDYVLEGDVEMHDATALTDDWRIHVPGVGSWRLRAAKYVITEAFLSLLRAQPGSTVAVAVTCEYGAGIGYVSHASLSVPNALVTEEVVITGTGALSDPE
jgi:hypothetical protein